MCWWASVGGQDLFGEVGIHVMTCGFGGQVLLCFRMCWIRDWIGVLGELSLVGQIFIW